MMKLRVLLGDHPHTAALKSGEVRSDLVEMDFAQYTPTNKGFKPMVRDAAFDVSELAVVTFLMAKAWGKPMVLLPDVMMARFQHSYAVTNPASGIVTPKDLEGKRVGIRSFTTATGAWLRGILADDYDVDMDAVNWITFEDPHVAEYIDTSTRAPAGKQVMQMLFDGELDAVLGEQSRDPRVNQLFPDAAAEEKAWFARHGVYPVNHVTVVSKNLSDNHPEIVREVHRMLRESRAAAAGQSPSFTDDELTRSLQMITKFSAQQGLIPRAYAVDELYDDVTRALR
ncbi:ABC transporter substrate-binding protein [soil metagenome]